MTVHQRTTTPGNDNVVKSVARTCETLILFDEMRRPLNVVEVSRRLGYPQSSTSALLKSMVTLGFLSHESKGRTYFPTERVSLIGSWMNPELFGEGTLQKMLRAISERSGQMVLLAVRTGDEAQYIQVVKPEETSIHHISLGTRRPLGKSCVGHVLLSSMQDGEVRSLYHRINAFRDIDTPTVDINELLTSLQEIRAKGYVWSTDRIVKGAGLISVPLPRRVTSRLLAIGIGAPSDVILNQKQDLLQIMREEIAISFGPALAERTHSPVRSNYG